MFSFLENHQLVEIGPECGGTPKEGRFDWHDYVHVASGWPEEALALLPVLHDPGFSFAEVADNAPHWQDANARVLLAAIELWRSSSRLCGDLGHAGFRNGPSENDLRDVPAVLAWVERQIVTSFSDQQAATLAVAKWRQEVAAIGVTSKRQRQLARVRRAFDELTAAIDGADALEGEECIFGEHSVEKCLSELEEQIARRTASAAGRRALPGRNRGQDCRRTSEACRRLRGRASGIPDPAGRGSRRPCRGHRSGRPRVRSTIGSQPPRAPDSGRESKR